MTALVVIGELMKDVDAPDEVLGNAAYRSLQTYTSSAKGPWSTEVVKTFSPEFMTRVAGLWAFNLKISAARAVAVVLDEDANASTRTMSDFARALLDQALGNVEEAIGPEPSILLYLVDKFAARCRSSGMRSEEWLAEVGKALTDARDALPRRSDDRSSPDE